jgi:Holliday junction resolvase
MRRPAADYLEAEKIEQLADDLSRAGYVVEREVRIGDQRFDLIAQRNGERLAFEVKARSRLQESAGQLARLRAAARQAGVDSFRLVVVNPPREVDVTIEGLNWELTRYLQEHLPSELDQISSETIVEDVSDIQIGVADLRRSGIHVRGTAAVDVQLNYDGGAQRDGLTETDSFPFTFDIELGADWKLAHMNEIEVNVDSFYFGDGSDEEQDDAEK